MGFKKSILHFPILAFSALSLLACSGLAGGGSASGGGSLDNPGGGVGVGGTGGPGGPGQLQVQSVPSTQQSEPGIGAPCGFSFVVKVKIMKEGAEQSCAEAQINGGTQVSARMVVPGDFNAENNEMAPPEDFGRGPVVTFRFRSQDEMEDRVSTVKTVCAADGQWQTEGGSLFYRANPHYDGGLHCPTYTASAQAKWNNLSSNTLSGPPFADVDETTGAVPFPLTIDLPVRATDGVVAPVRAILEK